MKSFLVRYKKQSKIFNRINIYAFLLSILIFVLLKIPYLSLPFFWDEAWSYIPAIFKMYETGPTLLPGQFDAWYSRGHPLLYYFLASGWASIFGFSVLSLHIFALCISLLLFVAVYHVGEKYLGKNTGLVASWLLMSHHAIFVQSTFVLPEILLALLLSLTLVFYLEKKWKWYMLFGSLSLLTKETALTFIPVVILYECIVHFHDGFSTKKVRQTAYVLLKKLMLLLTPLIPLIVFLILQKRIEGWYFYPGHTEFLTPVPEEIFSKLTSVFNLIFVLNSQWFGLFIAFSSYIYLRYHHVQISRITNYFILYTLFFMSFSIFSSVNFFSPRYTISLFPLWYLILVPLLFELKYKWIILFCASILIGINIVNTITYNKQNDRSIGYTDAVKTSKQAVEFLEENKYFDKRICTSFLMLYHLKNPEIGYLSSGNKFNHVKNKQCVSNSDIYVITSLDSDLNHEHIRKHHQLVKKFESGSAWVEIYYSDKLFKTENK